MNIWKQEESEEKRREKLIELAQSGKNRDEKNLINDLFSG